MGYGVEINTKQEKGVEINTRGGVEINPYNINRGYNIKKDY